MNETLFDVNFQFFKEGIEVMTSQSKHFLNIILEQIEEKSLYKKENVELTKLEICTRLKIEIYDISAIENAIDLVMTETIFSYKSKISDKKVVGLRSTIEKIKYSDHNNLVTVKFIEESIPFVINYMLEKKEEQSRLLNNYDLEEKIIKKL